MEPAAAAVLAHHRSGLVALAERLPNQECDRKLRPSPLVAPRIQLPQCISGVHTRQVLLFQHRVCARHGTGHKLIHQFLAGRERRSGNCARTRLIQMS